MRTRRCATTRKPACSIMALIAPVRFRAVASGLMIEKVRSIAIAKRVLWQGNGGRDIAAAYSGRLCGRQAGLTATFLALATALARARQAPLRCPPAAGRPAQRRS